MSKANMQTQNPQGARPMLSLAEQLARTLDDDGADHDEQRDRERADDDEGTFGG